MKNCLLCPWNLSKAYPRRRKKSFVKARTLSLELTTADEKLPAVSMKFLKSLPPQKNKTGLHTHLHSNTNKSALKKYLKRHIFRRTSVFTSMSFCHNRLLKSWSVSTGSMQKVWIQKMPLCWAQICILTGTIVPSLLWHFLHQFFTVLFCSQPK